MAAVRLDALLAGQLGLTRKQARTLCRERQVRVDGVPVTAPDARVDPDRQAVTAAGKPVVWRQFVYLMLHKPAGVLSASRDPSRPTAVDLAPPAYAHRALFPVGRLDRDTTGLLLLTDDGATAHRLLAPRRHVAKVYEVTLDGPLPPDAADRFAAGIPLADGTRCLPAGLRPLRGGDKPMAEVTLTQGMYHQIKRMFGVLGLGVTALHRTAVGPLRLDPALPPGGCRELTADELTALLAAAGPSPKA